MVTDPTSLQQGLLVTSGTTSTGSASLATTTSSSNLSLLSDPNYYTYGTGILASLGTIGSVVISGAVFVGVGLLSYAITKAALEK